MIKLGETNQKWRDKGVTLIPQCGGLKEIDPEGSGTIKMCGLVEVGVDFLEEVYHCGAAFEVSYKL